MQLLNATECNSEFSGKGKKKEKLFMKTYKFMLPCHTAEMKNKIIKQVLITIIFLEYRCITNRPECNSRERQQQKVWGVCEMTAALTAIMWDPSPLMESQSSNGNLYLFLCATYGWCILMVFCFFKCSLHSLVVTGTAHRAAVHVLYLFQLLVI